MPADSFDICVRKITGLFRNKIYAIVAIYLLHILYRLAASANYYGSTTADYDEPIICFSSEGLDSMVDSMSLAGIIGEQQLKVDQITQHQSNNASATPGRYAIKTHS